MSLHHVQTFYFFKELPESHLESFKSWLQSQAEIHNVLGLVIMGVEGLNTTLSSDSEASLDAFVHLVSAFFSAPEFQIKKSVSTKRPFRRFVVKIRKEIVTLGRPELRPQGEHSHLTPEQWHQMLQQQDVVVVDTRNDYEVEIGTFKNALDLEIKEFSEFPDKIKNLKTDKSKPHLIFCTGGIRCEKAIYEMEQQGFEQVYQLEGGIISYMEKFPDGEFKGECFVFDSRVALNSELQASQAYSLCPQCGEVASIEIKCVKCQSLAKICKKCHDQTKVKTELKTCSKNCRHHYLRAPDKKGPQQKQFYHSL